MLSEKLSGIKQIGRLIGLLVFLALACNAPIGDNGTPSPPPPTGSAVQTPATTETEQPTTAETPTTETEPTTQSDPTTAATDTPTSLPTFTPIQATVPPDTTPTQTPIPTAAPAATATSKADAGPLSFTFAISWEVVAGNPSLAIATVSIVATGGGGDYQYFRDDLPVSGPIFQYEWATCRANPGSLRVTSADGQTLKIDYFEQPPCPSP